LFFLRRKIEGGKGGEEPGLCATISGKKEGEKGRVRRGKKWLKQEVVHEISTPCLVR